MKKILFALIALTINIGVNAQTEPGVQVKIVNYTNCGYYVLANPIQSFQVAYTNCVQVPQVTVFVPPVSASGPGMAFLPGMAGAHYEVATILDNLMSPSYYHEIQAPNSASPGWSSGSTLQCYTANTFPNCMASVDCVGLSSETCWDGTSDLPLIQINN